MQSQPGWYGQQEERARASGVADELQAWRRHFWAGHAPPGAPRDLLGILAGAEYRRGGRPGPDLPRTAGRDGWAVDLAVAAVRGLARCPGTAPRPDLLLLAPRSPELGTALTEVWTRHAATNPEAATAQVRTRLLSGPPAAEAAFLLDLSEATGLRPLRPVECAPWLRPDRRVRHAAWRYLAGIPRGYEVLPSTAPHPSDAYEVLLLAACWHRACPRAPQAAAFRNTVQALPGAEPGPVVAQSMLLGNPAEPGVGMSGGMGVLLAALGGALTGTGRIGRVLTLVTADRAALRGGRVGLVSLLGPGHWQVGIPVDADGPLDPAVIAEHRSALAWWAARLLELPGARPRLVHVRFADDGSLAVADAARRCGAGLAFTVTPDPHRTMVERHAGLPALPDADAGGTLRADLHRIFVADRLVARADLLVGIPGRAGSRELAAHFPQLAGPLPRRVVEVPEGIPPFVPQPDDDGLAQAMAARLFADGRRPDGLDPADRGLQLLLNVGRLHPVKQQARLVEAWLQAGLHRSTTLLLVGGSPGEPTPVESDMRAAIGKVLAPHPEARRRVALWPALPNRQVRVLERMLAAEKPGGVLYVCPSAKEEFGLAILEAMEAGLAAAGPLRGGVPHYMRHGLNGFLLPTGATAELAAALASACDVSDAGLAAIAARGRSTVRRSYSVRAMADALAEAYAASFGG